MEPTNQQMKPSTDEGAVAAWHADPHGVALLRYHDGEAWTETTLGQKGWQPEFRQYWDDDVQKTRVVRNDAFWEHELYTRRGSCPPLQAVYAKLPKVPARNYLPFLLGAVFTLPALAILVFSNNVADIGRYINTPALSYLAIVTGVFLPWALAIFVAAWKKRALLADTPKVDIAGAHLGLCEMSGVVEPYCAPAAGLLSNSRLIWGETTAENDFYIYNVSETNKYNISYGQPMFYLKSDDGAKLLISLDTSLRDATRAICSEQGFIDYQGSWALKERGVAVGDRLFVFGSVQLTEDGEQILSESLVPGNHIHNKTFIASQVPEKKITQQANRVLSWASVQLASLAAVFGASLSLRLGGLSIANAISGLLTTAGVAAGFLVVLWGWRTWNRLVEAKWRVAAAWSLVDVAQSRRYRLLPGLAEIAKAGKVWERTTQQESTILRAPSKEQVADVKKVDNEDARLISRITHLAESTPELRADELFVELFQQIQRAENQVAAAKTFYNDAVTVAANLQQTYPTALLSRVALGKVPPVL